jgi:hypothetical protein
MEQLKYRTLQNRPNSGKSLGTLPTFTGTLAVSLIRFLKPLFNTAHPGSSASEHRYFKDRQ